MKNQVIFLMLILTFVSCKNESSQEPVEASTTNESEITATKEQFENEKMVLGKLSNQSFEQAILTSGMIDVPPHNKANISTFMGGYVVKTPLLVGDRV
ncbi:MAG: efflux transporter periplasmic adaptor subunit, partial [Mangrovimonas sp.]|nr:efflux transporter periplasmic adaptor subunit [Mangrovimonas sp.]